MKLYLRNMISDALVLFMNKQENSLIHLSMIMSRAAVFERKGLTRLALQEIKKGILLANKNNYPFIEHWFATRDMNLRPVNFSSKEKYLYEKKSEKNLRHLLEVQKSNDRFSFERKKIFALIMKNQRLASIDISEEDIDFKYFRDSNNALSIQAKQYRFDGLCEYYHHQKEHKEEYEIAQRYLEFTKQLFKKSNRYATAYSRALLFAGRASINLGKVNMAEKHLNEMVNLKTPNERFNTVQKSQYVRFMLLLYTSQNLYKEGLNFVKKAEDDYPSAFLNTKENFQYDTNISTSALVYFRNKEYDNLFKTINNLDQKLIELRSPIYLRDVEILRLMVQIELRNYELLPNLVRSAIGRLKKMNMYNHYEKTLLGFFAKADIYRMVDLATTVSKQLKKIDLSADSDKLTSYCIGSYAYTDWLDELSAQKSLL
ncbi:MAG: hypothetical protein U0T74_09620 [Chitinophagales bacterium]